VRTISDEERRARLGRRHLLASPGRSAERATAAMVGLHSSDPATVFLSARARVRDLTPARLEAALYGRRSLVRMLGMRRTLFVVSRDSVGLVDVACTRAIAPNERRRLIGWIESQGIASDGAAWLRRVSAATMRAIRARGEAAAVELTAAVPDLGTKLRFGEGTRWAADVGMSTRVLFLLAAEGKIVRARPRGSWISGQYRWAPLDDWLGEPRASIPHTEASAELLRRWLSAFAPATSTDIRWWMGWTKRQTTATLDRLDVAEVATDDGTSAFVLADDTRSVRRPRPWVALLPGLDATTMGWKQRDWYLGKHAGALFDTNGNAGPTVWANGRVVGGWAQAKDGAINVELLERVDRQTERLVRTHRDALREWLGDIRFTPRFRTPLERSLTD
jgi:DNA glycosylase AlkZ-like